MASLTQSEQLARKPEPPLPKSNLSKLQNGEVGQSQDEQEPHLGEKERYRSESIGGKGGLHSEGGQVPRRKGRACKKIISRRSRRKHERVSGRKNSKRESEMSWFQSKSAQS